MDVQLTCNEQYSESFMVLPAIKNTFCRVAGARIHVTIKLSFHCKNESHGRSPTVWLASV